MNTRLKLPLNALYLTVTLVVIFGCIFLGSSSAFNAIISASVVALGVSYAIPLSINCLRGRKMLPDTRPFVLRGLFGWATNLLGIAYVIVTTVLFVFPPVLPVSGRYVSFLIQQTPKLPTKKYHSPLHLSLSLRMIWPALLPSTSTDAPQSCC